MKITKSQLKQIIKEELEKTLEEQEGSEREELDGTNFEELVDQFNQLTFEGFDLAPLARIQRGNGAPYVYIAAEYDQKMSTPWARFRSPESFKQAANAAIAALRDRGVGRGGMSAFEGTLQQMSED